jgi:DNA gyrase/topoisomerase IV subunit B
VIEALAAMEDLDEKALEGEKSARALARRLEEGFAIAPSARKEEAAPSLDCAVERAADDAECFVILCRVRRGGLTKETIVDKTLVASKEIRELRRLLKAIEAAGRPPFFISADSMEEEAATFAELTERVLEYGKKGLTIQRYKGLGEMNPEQLWETTMDPERRVLLRVKIEDDVEADTIFTRLMGDSVEPRRAFIQEHALETTNLDI